MDEQTARFYSERAHEMALRYEGIQGVPRSLSWLAWKQGARVLDVGCGSGRDLADARSTRLRCLGSRANRRAPGGGICPASRTVRTPRRRQPA